LALAIIGNYANVLFRLGYRRQLLETVKWACSAFLAELACQHLWCHRRKVS
jgi:hypothetical protein